MRGARLPGCFAFVRPTASRRAGLHENERMLPKQSLMIVDSRANTALISPQAYRDPLFRVQRAVDVMNGMNQYQKYDHASEKCSGMRLETQNTTRQAATEVIQRHNSPLCCTVRWYATPLSTKTSRRKAPPCDTTRLTPCHTMTPSPTRTRRAPKWNTSGGAPLPLVPLVAKDAGEGAHETLLLW